MLDKPNAIALLEHLRGQCSSLLSLPRLGGDFYQWYLDVLAALERIFGADSNERSEFQRIEFGINPEMLCRTRALLALPDDIEIPEDLYYKKRLSEAQEVLFTMILTLKSRKDDLPG